MVEIVNRGVPYEDRKFRVICRNCRSYLKFQGSETKEVFGMRGLQCPVCHRFILTDANHSLEDVTDGSAE